MRYQNYPQLALTSKLRGSSTKGCVDCGTQVSERKIPENEDNVLILE